MFPKFLRIAARGRKQLLRINETAAIEKTVPYGYSVVKQLNVLSTILRFSYEFVYPTDENSFGRLLPNGSWTGTLGIIQRGQADMAVGIIAQTAQRNEGFAFSFPHLITEITFVTRKHEYVPNTAVFLRPFSLPVWLSIIICVCVMPFIFQCLLKKKHSHFMLSNSIAGSLVGQGSRLKPEKSREYFLLAFWILGSGILCYIYAAVLLAFVTFPTLQGVRTIEDLADGIKGEKYLSTTYPDAFYASVFLNSSDSGVQAIGRSLQQSQHFVYFAEALETYADDRIPAFVGVKYEFVPYKQIYFVPESGFFYVSGAYALRKGFCCKSELDEALHHIWASGIFEKIRDDDCYRAFLYGYKTYGKYWNSRSPGVGLTIALFKGPFLFLAASHALAFLILLIEICLGKFNHKQQYR